MRVLEGVAHIVDYQSVATVCSQNEHFPVPKISLFEQF